MSSRTFQDIEKLTVELGACAYKLAGDEPLTPAELFVIGNTFIAQGMIRVVNGYNQVKAEEILAAAMQTEGNA